MIKINDVSTALQLFEEAAMVHKNSKESGDYKAGNKAHALVCKAAGFLKKRNALLELKKFFHHPSVGPRGWAAAYLLPVIEHESVEVLKNIAKREDFNGTDAEIVLSEWYKGNLR